MNVYTITYYLKEAPHSCGCEDHGDDHNCGCSDHHHDDHECCGGHNHDDHECCGGHNHDDHECCGGHNHDDHECCNGHEDDCQCNGEHDHHHHYEEVRDDYEITAHIKTLGSWAHFMPTSFLVRTEKSANEILDILAPTVIEGDMIFVNKIDKNDVSCLTPAVIDWINR